MVNTALNQLENQQDEHTLHKMNMPDKKDTSSVFSFQKSFGILIAVVILGSLVGFGASFLTKGSSTTTEQTNETEKEDSGDVAQKAGINDKKKFKDNATGILKEGGIEGEGDFHLERPGGAAQNVYLTSTTVDLSEYVGKKITVWGETYSAEKAGWLMDAGYIEVVSE